jgi:DNA-binding NtrC family response regulator
MRMAAAILLIEDDDETARLIGRALEHHAAGFAVTAVCSMQAGLAHLAARPVDGVLLDYRLPDGDGLACLREIRKRHPQVPVIFVTGAGSEDVAVEAMQHGARSYVTKHGQYLPRLLDRLREALGARELEQVARGRSARPAITGRPSLQLRERYRLEGIVGQSAALAAVLADAERAARARDVVLIEGETGTGKDVLARAIHNQGVRRPGPFVIQNCAALPDSLLESELFGFARGAFTGADRPHPGLFAQAHGGTLFLDEISAASLPVQAKLLRVLEDGAVRPLGSDRVTTVDVRVIAATNRDLREAAQDGSFRPDLYYRLEQLRVRLPALRERREDVALLAQHFLTELAAGDGTTLRGFDSRALRALEDYPWPGNIRELKSEIHRIASRAEGRQRVTLDLLSPWIVPAAPAADTARPLKEIVHEVEVAVIHARLREHGYHRAATARSLGLSRESLWAKMRQLGIRLQAREEDEYA